jgi:hypothetical protein
MRFEGTLVHDGKFWLAEIPLLNGMTQGRTRKEALYMARLAGNDDRPRWL